MHPMSSASSPSWWMEMEYLASMAQRSREPAPTETPPNWTFGVPFSNWWPTSAPEHLRSTLRRLSLSLASSLSPSLRYLRGFRLPWPMPQSQTETMRELEMVCGECSSYLALADEEPSTAILNLAYRFANAHVRCGYMTSGTSPEADEMDGEPVASDQEPLEN